LNKKNAKKQTTATTANIMKKEPVNDTPLNPSTTPFCLLNSRMISGAIRK
jgi:hypothetical protein